MSARGGHSRAERRKQRIPRPRLGGTAGRPPEACRRRQATESRACSGVNTLYYYNLTEAKVFQYY
ncbi:MAG: hypothetical protein A3D39_05490 [Candidatus Buchananbacteria bacterium RIFCSPHIGHO2_02_FULL_39_17]|nr:MAG: hypothetical protein A3D39_05490 [Candidatus Buchananbacteria bacterium RIFCSPHIGHO2_02_FULL_39_17]